MNIRIVLKNICLFMILMLLTVGCSSKYKNEAVENEAVNSSINYKQSPGELLQIQSDTIKKFVENLGYEIEINSGVATGIKLPKDFTFKNDSFEIGKFLYDKNQLSKKFNLDFSNYMGKSLYLLGYQMTSNGVAKGNILVLFDDNKMVGVWIGNSNEEDLKVLMRNLETYNY